MYSDKKFIFGMLHDYTNIIAIIVLNASVSTGTSIESGGVKLFLWALISALSEMMRMLSWPVLCSPLETIFHDME